MRRKPKTQGTLWGAAGPGRWTEVTDGRTTTVMGWCDECQAPKPARDIQIRPKPFGRGEVRTCGNHQTPKEDESYDAWAYRRAFEAALKALAAEAAEAE